jgi:hypothetical protein
VRGLFPVRPRKEESLATESFSPASGGPMTRGMPRGAAASVLILLALSSCSGNSEPNVDGASLVDTAQAYVNAINAHDGKAVCDLMLPSVAYEFRIEGWGECPKFVSAYIGYTEDSGSRKFVRAMILAAGPAEPRGELRSVPMAVQVTFEGSDAVLDDVLWFVERNGSWRIAKASAVLYAAFGGNAAEDVLAPPDLIAQERDYAAKVAAERQEKEAEDASFQAPRTTRIECAGAQTSYDDSGNDYLHFQGGRELTASEARRYAAANIERVEVETEGEALCVRFTQASDEVEERLVMRFDIYSPKKNPTYLGGQLELFMEILPDGRARLAHENLDEEDDWGRHPLIPLPAELGHEGDTFSFRVERSELDPIMDERELPPWSGFLWGGLTFYLVRVDGNPRAVSDEIHGYLAMISHPGGRVFESGERQKRDLPTD